MKTFKVYDNCEKTLVYDTTTGTPEKKFRDMKVMEFDSHEKAIDWIDDYLSAGNYPDKPTSVLEVVSPN